MLSEPFIDIVLIKGDSTSLLLNKTELFLICVNFYISHSRYMVITFKECAGLFYQDRIKPIIEAIVNLVVSIILAYYIGLIGIIIGTIVSSICVCVFVEPYVLNKHYFKQSTIKYVGKYLLYTLSMVVSAIITIFVCYFIPHNSIGYLILKFIVCGCVAFVSMLLTMLPFKEFQDSLKWTKSLFIRENNAKSNKQ